MFSDFKKHIEASFSELHNHKVLVAVSGGVDSVVLAHLLHANQIEIALAHCNFQLRDDDSLRDQSFVEELAKKLEIPFFTVNFDTEAEAKKEKESIQVTARNLRYNWFYETAKQNEYQYIATAHHLNDSLENYLMHTTRGTGIKGLLGVPKQTHNVIRPLLPFSKSAIEVEADKQGWEWREDASNQKDKYFRNRIRNTVIPILENENPNLLASFQETLTHLQQTNNLLEDYTALLYKELITLKENYYSLDLNKLKKLPNTNAVLYQLLHTFGFTDWESVYDLKNAETGKQVFSQTHILEKNRNELLIYLNSQVENKTSFDVRQIDKVVKFENSILKFEEVEEMGETGKNVAYVDVSKLKFPLRLRKVNNEDQFFPLGMKSSKKVNHFLRDEKVPTSIKQQTWVLCSNEIVVWVINHRINEKYKITENTKKCLKISCLNT